MQVCHSRHSSSFTFLRTSILTLRTSPGWHRIRESVGRTSPIPQLVSGDLFLKGSLAAHRGHLLCLLGTCSSPIGNCTINVGGVPQLVIIRMCVVNTCKTLFVVVITSAPPPTPEFTFCVFNVGLAPCDDIEVQVASNIPSGRHRPFARGRGLGGRHIVIQYQGVGVRGPRIALCSRSLRQKHKYSNRWRNHPVPLLLLPCSTEHSHILF